MAPAPSSARPALTHFLCLPLVTPASRPQLSRALESFRADVTTNLAVPEAAVRPLGTLHLTLGVMSLAKPDALAQAVALLRSLRPREVLASLQADAPGAAAAAGTTGTEQDKTAPPALSVSLRGIHSMQASASKTTVLYAPPVVSERRAGDSGLLQRFCESVAGVFRAEGLLVDEGRPLLLHATVVNTVYVRSQGRGGGDGKKKREMVTIDAREILDRYEDFVWMQDVPIDRIAICRMGAKKVEVDGVEDMEYEVEAEVEI